MSFWPFSFQPSVRPFSLLSSFSSSSLSLQPPSCTSAREAFAWFGESFNFFYLFSPELFKILIYFGLTFYLFSLQLFNFSFTSGKLRCLSAKQAPELFAAPRRPEKRNVRNTFWEIWHNPRQMLDVQFEKSDWLKYCFRGTITQLNSHYLALRPRFLFGFLESAGNWKVWDCVHLIL